MNRQRMFAGLGVVTALAITLIVLSVQGQSPTPPTTTIAVLAVPTTTLPPPSSATTAASTTLTTTSEQRLAEVEVLLGDLWFGWFDAIYRKDPDALWDVVATAKGHDSGVAAMDNLVNEVPTPDSFAISDVDILLDRPDCLVVGYTIDASNIIDEPAAPFVSVMWSDVRYGFRFATDWRLANDIWMADCDNLEREVTP